jgi:hypothetical protein
MSQENDTPLIEELSKILWHLERKGYIQTFDQDQEGEVENLRHIGRDAVRRARIRLGLPPLLNEKP